MRASRQDRAQELPADGPKALLETSWLSLGGKASRGKWETWAADTGSRVIWPCRVTGCRRTPSVAYKDGAAAVAMAIEGVDDPAIQEVRVVDVATGTVVWRSTEDEYE